MKRNLVIYNIKFTSNIDGWKNYHISRRGRLYRYYPNRGVWMVFNGTISRGRVYHILRNSTSRIRIQASRLVARCKLGYHEWVALHSYEYRQRPRRAIFSHKGGRKKAQYYTKRKTEYYCNNCGRKK